MTYKSLLGYFSSESTMFTSLPPRRLRWSAWAAGRSSPNCVPAPYSGNVTSRTRQNRSQSDAPGPKTDLRIVSLRPECPDANGPGLVRAGPSGEERCTPHYTVPVSPQCPQEISLLTLPVFQGAAVPSELFLSVFSAQKCSGAGRLATPSGVSRAARSAVPCRSSVPGHRASRSKYTRGQSQETGSLSKSSGGVGALAKRVLLGPAWADSGSLVFLRDDAGLRTVVSNGRLLRQSWCYIPGLMRAGPSGEERCTPHYTVPVSPQCPQEISLLTLPVFQGAAVSSECFSQSLLPRNVAELGGSPPLRGSLEQLDWPSPAGPPLQGTELAALSTPETSLERLVPLVDYSAAWKLLPNVSRWAGSGNGTRSKHSPEGGDHRGGPCSRQRVQVLQPYFIVPGKGVASVLDLS